MLKHFCVGLGGVKDIFSLGIFHVFNVISSGYENFYLTVRLLF